ncbi:MAG: hypothetical protein K2Y71_04545 [Xanthobacteraceae bacterium]|nr:hypothetical protein [Xanthobacteraceae bacterium]
MTHRIPGYYGRIAKPGGGVSGSQIREKLTANRTYYVRTDGSDSNNGLANTSGGAFLTIQKAVDTAAALDLGIYNVTISVGAGTFTTPVVLKSYVGFGPITIDGAGLASTTVSTTSAHGFSATNVTGQWNISNLAITTTTGGIALNVDRSYVRFSAIAFGACATYHIVATAGGVVTCFGNYTINGNAQIHWLAQNNGFIGVSGVTITLTGTPAFSVQFANAGLVASMDVRNNTFSGSATGTRYLANRNAVIETNGGGATYLPGNAGGSTATGGQYL